MPCTKCMFYSIRLATLSDSPAVADLLVQLAEAEAPGVLVGSIERQRSLLRYTLELNHGADLRHRLVGENDHGIIGTAAAHVPGTPSKSQVNGAALRMAIALLGYRTSARVLFALSLDMIAARLARPRRPANALYVYGVSINSAHRGRGVGRALMHHCETIARQHDLLIIQLRVIVSNRNALDFYRHLGYKVVGRTPRWLDLFAFPTLVLQKRLDSTEQ
jgi:ribosomal protein S18 acetylase RimI-like enzyme